MEFITGLLHTILDKATHPVNCAVNYGHAILTDSATFVNCVVKNIVG